jgi:hypothetical protein
LVGHDERWRESERKREPAIDGTMCVCVCADTRATRREQGHGNPHRFVAVCRECAPRPWALHARADSVRCRSPVESRTATTDRRAGEGRASPPAPKGPVFSLRATRTMRVRVCVSHWDVERGRDHRVSAAKKCAAQRRDGARKVCTRRRSQLDVQGELKCGYLWGIYIYMYVCRYIYVCL